MKAIIKTSLLISVFSIILGCTPFYHSITTEITNSSGKDIEISSFHTYSNTRLSKKFNLKDHEKFSKKGKVYNDGYLVPVSFEELVEGDSIVIDFGDRIKSYSKSNLGIDNNRNPYYLYPHYSNNDIIYTITPEDYINAKSKQ